MLIVTLTVINEEILMDQVHFHDVKCEKLITILPGYKASILIYLELYFALLQKK